jgi:dTMP kinase|tara:strand:- start:13 stop:654 length:642 start_codon:yes stop_codon:yes gene_type:complete
MTKNRGLFITVEGVEGVGKSTNIETIKNFLAEKNVEFVLTREPGGTLIAEQIREILLKPHEEKLTELSELLLVFAARAQHVATVIKPALVSGRWVICDRFTDATYAYQGGGRGLNKSIITRLEDMVQNELRPDLTIILDLDPETGMERAAKRGSLDRFEQEHLEFFNKVRAVYLEIARAEPRRCVIVDASSPIETVQANLRAIIQSKLAEYFD